MECKVSLTLDWHAQKNRKPKNTGMHLRNFMKSNLLSKGKLLVLFIPSKSLAYNLIFGSFKVI